MSSAALPRSWPWASGATSAGTAPLVAVALLVATAPLAQVLCSALASMKQAVPAAWQCCPQQLPAPAGRSCCPQAACCLRSGAFPTLMRLGRLGPSSPSALIKVLVALPGGVGGSGPISRPAGDATSRCSPSGQGGGGSGSGADSPAR